MPQTRTNTPATIGADDPTAENPDGSASTSSSSKPATPATPGRNPVTARRLAIMGQIMTRLEKPELTTGDKIWIRDTLSAQIEAEL
jgi:hypothetical protein